MCQNWLQQTHHRRCRLEVRQLVLEPIRQKSQLRCLRSNCCQKIVNRGVPRPRNLSQS